jgi:hypothetical protein
MYKWLSRLEANFFPALAVFERVHKARGSQLVSTAGVYTEPAPTQTKSKPRRLATRRQRGDP